MAKSLGLIHTVEYALSNAATNDAGLIDLPGQLSKSLQHKVRAMSSFKVTGIDIALDGTANAAVAGRILYFAPTKGRVEALKYAWQACKTMFKTKGVKYWNNLNYDFRPIWQDPTTILLTGATGADFLNQASLELVGGVEQPLCLIAPPVGVSSVFATYNANIQPDQTGVPDFNQGYTTMSGTTGDMVINEGRYLVSLIPEASEDPEEIPFQLSLDTTDDSASSTFMWRPDPILYLSVLTGQMLVVIDSSSDTGADLNMSVHVAGWKSIMGSHRRRKTSSKRKTHGRKRHSKK